MGIGIFNVKAEDNEVISCCQGDKETEHGVFQTGSKGVSLLMEPGGTAEGAIAAEASTTITVGFDAIVPDSTEDDAIKFVVGAEPSGGSKHFHIAKLVELFEFPGVPVGPGGKLFEFATGESADGAFLLSDVFIGEGVEMGGRERRGRFDRL